MKVYKRGESIPDTWLFLHRREGYGIKPMWVLTFKLPWRARIYTINNDNFQLRRPRVSLYWGCISDPWFHQCTKEELERQNAYYQL